MSDPGSLPVSPPASCDGGRRRGISWARRIGPLGWVYLVLAAGEVAVVVLAFSYPAPPFPLAFAAAVGVAAPVWGLGGAAIMVALVDRAG